MSVWTEEEIFGQQQVSGAVRMNVSLDRERRQDLPTGGNWSRGRCDVALWRLPLWELSGRVSCLDNEVEKKEKEHVLPRLCTTTRQRTTRRLRTLRSQRHVCTVPRKQDFPQILKRSTCTAENHNQKNFQNNVASHASTACPCPLQNYCFFLFVCLYLLFFNLLFLDVV